MAKRLIASMTLRAGYRQSSDFKILDLAMASAATVAITRRVVTWPSARTVILAIAWLLFFGLCALPTLYMLGISFGGADGGFSLVKYRHLLTDAWQRDLLFTSTLL